MAKVILICGPSASGKDTLVSKLVQTSPNLYHKCVLATSRPRRDYEEEGVDYYFKDYWDLMLSPSSFLFPIAYNGWAYAIPQNEIIEGKNNLIVSNSYWALKINKHLPENWDVKTFYLDTSDKERLLRSLAREENPDCKEICRRFLADEDDWGYFLKNYSDKITIISDNDSAVEKIINL